MDPKIIVDGKPYPFPLSLTLGEEAECERITGQGYDMNKPGALGFLALAYVAIKRVDPTVRVEDLELLGADSFSVEKGDDPESPPLSDADSSENSEPSTDDSASGSDVAA